jgi:hypothetical protein
MTIIDGEFDGQGRRRRCEPQSRSGFCVRQPSSFMVAAAAPLAPTENPTARTCPGSTD